MVVSGSSRLLIFFVSGKYPEAAAYFNKALLLDPRNAKRMVNTATAKFAMNDNAGADKILDNALSLHPDLAEAKELKAKISTRSAKKLNQ